jgi:5,10-methylenetetrahydromethanopterin reductase
MVPGREVNRITRYLAPRTDQWTCPAERHLAVHDQHLTDLNAADNAAWKAGSWQAIISTTVSGTPDRIRDQLSAYARDGITEIVYQPTGPDIPGELERFITIARDV